MSFMKLEALHPGLVVNVVSSVGVVLALSPTSLAPPSLHSPAEISLSFPIRSPARRGLFSPHFSLSRLSHFMHARSILKHPLYVISD